MEFFLKKALLTVFSDCCAVLLFYLMNSYHLGTYGLITITSHTEKVAFYHNHFDDIFTIIPFL